MEHPGRKAIVTGAASGIGRATAEILSARGARVLAVDKDSAKLDWAAQHDGVRTQVADVTLEADQASIAETARVDLGGIDALVLNAGAAVAGGMADLSLDDFERALAVNLRGVVMGLRAALPALRRSPSPSVVVTASVSGLGGDPGLWAYNTAKGAVVNFVRAAALELGPTGIRVNAVCPGPIRTGMTSPIEGSPSAFEALRRQIPLGRWGEAREVAEVIAFLVSDGASFVNGAIIPVDGGITANTGQFRPPVDA